MPVTLAVLSKNAAPEPTLAPDRSVTFDGTRVVLGRSASADLVLPDASVSQRHATIRTSGAEYVVVDEGSTNGTFLGEVRLTPHLPKTLRTGDRLRLGRVWIEARFGAAPPTRDLALATRDLALAMVGELLGAEGHGTLPRVEVHGGPDDGATLTLSEEGRAYVVGRGDTCDLLLADPDCSREHVCFLRRSGQTFVVDLGSKNGSYLGRDRLPPQVEIRVQSGRAVELGRTVLVVEEPVERALANLSSAPEDERLDDTLTPEPAPSAAPAAPVPETPTTLKSNIEASPPPASRSGVPSERPVAITRAPARSRGLSPADVAVILGAVTLIGLSAAGLYWLIGPGK